MKYTNPLLKKGKAVTHVPKGSNKVTEQAKQTWYIEYYYKDSATGKMKQIRVSNGLNRIKDPIEKQLRFEELKNNIKSKLADGYNPSCKSREEKNVQGTICLIDAINIYQQYHTINQSRNKTINSYLSHLNQLLSFLATPTIKVNDIQTGNIESFVHKKIHEGDWSNATLKNFKRNLSAFFNFLIKDGYIKANPIHSFDKKIKSLKETPKVHVPYNDKDLKSVMEWLELHDKYGAFFCKMIYYTCLRPSEIKGLQLHHIDLDNGTITIPPHIKKNTHNPSKDVIIIDTNFKTELIRLRTKDYPSNYYLVGHSRNIIGSKKIGRNTPYVKLRRCLKALNLENNGYDLYSFKHTSNINRYKNGWKLHEIMKVNRHTTISQTETYLRDITILTDLSGKMLPKI